MKLTDLLDTRYVYIGHCMLHDRYCIVARLLLLEAVSQVVKDRKEDRRGRVTSHLTLLVLEGIGGSHVVTDTKSQSSTLSIPDKNDNMSPL